MYAIGSTRLPLKQYNKSCRLHKNVHPKIQMMNKSSIRQRTVIYNTPHAFQVGGDIISTNDTLFIQIQDTIVHNSYIIGEYIGYFVLFYAVLNWMTYRRIRKLTEEQNKKKK